MSPQKTNGRARANSSSHEASSANGHHHDHRSHSPQMKRVNSTRSNSSLSPGKSSLSLARSPSLHVHDHDSGTYRSSSPLPTRGKKQATSSFIVNGNSKNQLPTPVNKKPRDVTTPKSVDRCRVVSDQEDAFGDSPHSQMEDNSNSGPSGHSPTHVTEADGMSPEFIPNRGLIFFLLCRLEGDRL